MKSLLLVCAVLLFLGLADLPMGYYKLLRIIVTIGSVAVIVTEYENGSSFWIVTFALIAILFNPVIPIYFGDKSVWMIIDIISGIIFVIKSRKLKQN